MWRMRVVAVALVMAGPISIQAQAADSYDEAGLEGVLGAIRQLGLADPYWRLDSDAVVGVFSASPDSFVQVSSLVRRSLGPSVQVSTSVDSGSRCPLTRAGIPFEGCHQTAGLQVVSVGPSIRQPTERSGLDGPRAMFLVSVYRVGHQVTSESREGRTWIFNLQRGPDGEYKLTSIPGELIR